MTSKFKNITFLLLAVILVSACKKNWLDVTSVTEIRSDDQFKTENGFKDALMGVYIGMTDKALYSKDMNWNLIDILGQQYAPGVASNLNQYLDFQNYNYTTIQAAAKIDAIWNKAYNTIANVNNALANIDKNKAVLNPINYAIIKGELLGIRAFLHFDLMRVYGYGNLANRQEILTGKLAVPYVTQFTKNITPQVSYAKTFELLLKDLNEAAELLKEDPIYNNPKKPAAYYNDVNRDGFYKNRELRMNYYAVKALQARVLQWEGGSANMAGAALAAEEVIKDGPAKLLSSPGQASSDRALYGESLFNLNVTLFADIINVYLNGDDAANVNALYLTASRAEEVFETENLNIGIADIRYNTLLVSQVKGLVSVKFLQGKSVYAGRNSMPLMKLPEMYYIAAEQYANSNTIKAVDYLNEVRSSRGIIEEIPASSNAEEIRAEIYKEYRKEFIMEGQLFFFYKRLGKTTFPGLSSAKVANDQLYVLPYPVSELEFGNVVQ